MNPSILVAAEAPTVYEASKVYASLGMSVLPCDGKKPALKHWAHLQKRIATLPTIDLWQKTGLLTNVGIICGDVSDNLVVIDLDGNAAIDAFTIRFPGLLNTYTVRSGSGAGMHLYFYCRVLPPTTRVTGISYGNIELRANGCYVVAPPSIHPVSGKPYAVGDYCPITFVPDLNDVVNWIKRLIREKHGGTMPPAANAGKVRNATAYGAVALRNEANEVRGALPGERNNRLYRAALKMGSLITDGKIDRARVESELLAAASALSESDGEGATQRTIASGINQGMESSRERYKHA